jgi:hypothetical protein
MPILVNEPNCTIRTPNGFKNVKNPLYRYDFHPAPGAVSSSDSAFWFGNQSELPYTVRSPDYGGVSYPEKANARLEEEGQ